MINTKLHFKHDVTRTEQKSIEAAFEKMFHEKDSGEVGYYVLPETQQETLTQIEAFKKSNKLIAGGQLKDLVVMGIGGSSLGPKALDTVLAHLPVRNGINLHFLENGDPINLSAQLKKLEKDSTLFLMISKSGGTIETTSVTKCALAHFGMSFDSPEAGDHLAVITDQGSPLDQAASSKGIMAFHIPKNVGGRFSVLSAVGLLPLSIIGYDVDELLKGAAEQRNSFFSKSDDTFMEKAYYYAKYSNINRMNVLFSYCSAMRELNAWYVQIWGESLGKLNAQEQQVGLTPIGLVGSVDQHSFLQLVVQGPADKTVTFIKVKDFENDLIVPDMTIPNLEKTNYINGKPFASLINAQCDATAETLIERHVPVDVIEVERLCEKSVGMLVMYFEMLTSCVGAMMGVNTYDQPGVEFGKKKLVEKFS